LTTFEGKKVCFRNIVLPLLPRMIYGLYYNTPLFSNCQNSGLFRAFSQFIPYRLGVESPIHTDSRKLQVTIIRRMTKFRRILNLGTLIDELEKTGKFEVTVAEFSHSMSFKKQLQIVRNTDILVGIHGAGLLLRG
jgi:protein O-GlcNAc transferase